MKVVWAFARCSGTGTACSGLEQALARAISLICGVTVPAECLRNYFDGDGPQVAYVVSDGSLKLRQDGIDLGVGLGRNGLRAQKTHAIF